MTATRIDYENRVCGMSDNLALFAIHPMGVADTVYNFNYVLTHDYKQVKI